jgi:hypothetical protein
MSYYEIVIDGESIKRGLRPIIEALVMMLNDKEVNKYLDKEGMVNSALDQIVAILQKTEAITIK